MDVSPLAYMTVNDELPTATMLSSPRVLFWQDNFYLLETPELPDPVVRVIFF